MLPDTYSELYPGRFLKSDLLKGKKATLTIKNVDIEELIGETGKPAAKVIVSFSERPLELVLPKTNGECLRRMFGNNPHQWIGKRVTLFPSTTKFGRETVDCIRVWGSPDIDADMPITIPQGRKKPLDMVMHKVAVNEKVSINGKMLNVGPQVELDPRILTAFQILNWTDVERKGFLVGHAALDNAEMLSLLNNEIDTKYAEEK